MRKKVIQPSFFYEKGKNMNANKKDYKGKIKSIEKISKDTFKMQIESDLKNAKSGQFISIFCPNKTMRRPFSIADFDSDNGITTVLFKLKGDGTNYLKSLKAGDEIKFLGPNGNRFKLEKRKMPHTLRLLKEYAYKFDFDLWEEIFISASGEDISNKFKYVRSVIEDLVKENIYT